MLQHLGKRGNDHVQLAGVDHQLVVDLGHVELPRRRVGQRNLHPVAAVLRLEANPRRLGEHRVGLDGTEEPVGVPREAIEMIRIGEEAGDLGGMITRTSSDMREAVDRDLERFLLLFQPALIVGVGLMIGVSLYALFSAIVSVNAISF